MQRAHCAMTVLTALAILTLASCEGDVGGRLAISGTVEYKGEPVQQGTIEFIPHPGGKTQSGATITNGRFTIPKEKGLEPGVYTVKISSMEGLEPPAEPGGLPGKDPKELLPAKYNTKSTLTKEVSKTETKFEFKLD